MRRWRPRRSTTSSSCARAATLALQAGAGKRTADHPSFRPSATAAPFDPRTQSPGQSLPPAKRTDAKVSPLKTTGSAREPPEPPMPTLDQSSQAAPAAASSGAISPLQRAKPLTPYDFKIYGIEPHPSGVGYEWGKFGRVLEAVADSALGRSVGVARPPAIALYKRLPFKGPAAGGSRRGGVTHEGLNANMVVVKFATDQDATLFRRLAPYMTSAHADVQKILKPGQGSIKVEPWLPHVPT